MDSLKQVVFNLTERSYLNILKKDIVRLAEPAALPAKRVAELELVISEIATNLLKHAGGGELVVRVLSENANKGVEILSIDKGPGMADPNKMMEDGVSTTNTLGHGLGSIKRLSDQFQLYSSKGWGTVLLSRIFSQPVQSQQASAGIYPIILPKPGESLCGDAYVWKANPYFLKVMLADGLGHGPLANLAAQRACEAFRKSVFNNPSDILNDIHRHVKGTRGLVATVAVFDLINKVWTICGVGNISSRLSNALTSKTHMPFNGILGVNISGRLQSQKIENDTGSYLILCSDGISTRWETSRHTAVFKYDLSILAAVIYKDFARHSDDMSVVVVKVN
ncbi:ATP-binding SpoIIE family protein phosphatase [Dyadobacter sp. CY323]|uniref:ATP-binding SpoIIE family protein phosphatase n=1 Tax=Dyadobacter sp. CY323 TaxID=2907302 RepID=UPI001F333EC6|nr:ATP-binding SpoIIE family protein phosphatase [Dyadobacter sp. CY323]MCE6991249.1 ATP-binding protein/SpoIIE family protein phosphatase [Dyadobacter sp. CY323]